MWHPDHLAVQCNVVKCLKYDVMEIRLHCLTAAQNTGTTELTHLRENSDSDRVYYFI